MALPGRAKQPIVKQKTGGKPAEDDTTKDAIPAEPTFEEMKAMGKELKALQESGSREELQKIRLKKAQEEAKNKDKKSEEKIDLKDIKTEVEARKGGLPEHIAKLPKNHPIRLRWEKGFRQREDGTWYKPAEGFDYDGPLHLSQEKKQALYLIPVILLGIALVLGGNWYADQLSEVRKEIVKTIKLKNIPKDDPKTKEKLDAAYKSHWLPELKALLTEIKKIRRNFSEFGDNPEPGTYLQYIKRHNKPFDAQEAMQWRSRVIRKPHQ
ncbi:MAG: hypothetical protein HQL72_02070 [Magnetococcales bacterium]|nr:hypothetical protein [Magnetococcales bacterium]